MKKLSSRVGGISGIQAVGRSARALQMGVGRAVRIGFELRQQARHQVDSAAEFGHFLQVKRHPEIILGGMKPHPGHGVFAGDIVGVIRLMLVPQKRQ